MLKLLKFHEMILIVSVDAMFVVRFPRSLRLLCQ